MRSIVCNRTWSVKWTLHALMQCRIYLIRVRTVAQLPHISYHVPHYYYSSSALQHTRGHASIKLWSTINSWLQQGGDAFGTEKELEQLIEPQCPMLYVAGESQSHDSSSTTAAAAVAETAVAAAPSTTSAVASSSTSSTYPIVILISGPDNSAAAIAARNAGKMQQLTKTSATSVRPDINLFVAFDCAPDCSTELLYTTLTSLLPRDHPFMVGGTPASYHDSIWERMAKENDAYLIRWPHSQWMKLSKEETKEKKQGAEEVAASAPIQQEQQQQQQPSPSGSPGVSISMSPTSDSSATDATHLSYPSSFSSSSITSTSSTIKIAPLRLSHSELIAKWWPYTGSTTPIVMPYLIEHSLTRCVYVNDEPVCWVLLQTYGGLGMLHTMEEHRGKGYARLCVNSLCDALAERDLTPFCYIGLSNTASQKVFSSMGFTPHHDCDWTVFVPNRFGKASESEKKH